MLTIFMILALLALLLAGLVFLLLRFAYRLWRKPPPGTFLRRSAIIGLGLLIVGGPYFLIEWYERQFAIARVPAPLEFAAIEYRLEKSWGLGFLPGDNETGFVVYRLTNKSAAWARGQDAI